MSFHTLSAILRNEWLISEAYVQQHLPLVLQMARGEAVDFGLEKNEDESPRLHFQSPTCAVIGVGPSSNLSGIQPGNIAQVDIIGPVLKYGDLCSYGAADQASLINRLAVNGNVVGIILNIDSPGGQVSGTSMLADAIKAASRNKPVVAVIDDGIAASAAMWIASAATEIYATKKTDQVGSIGVYTTLADWYSYAKSQGLPVRDVYAPQSTDKNGDYREALAGNDEPLKQDLAVLADAFISTIQTNRAGKLTSDEWNTGKMFGAKEAAKIGLIDGIKPYTAVVKRVEQLISTRQTQKNNNMSAFARIMAAAAITEIAVVDGGFLVTEETLNAVEKALGENSTAIAAHTTAVEALNNTIAERDATIQQLQANDQAQTIADLQTQIVAKDARIAELAAKPAGNFKLPTKAAGDHLEGEATKYETSFDREKAELRQKAGKN